MECSPNQCSCLGVMLNHGIPNDRILGDSFEYILNLSREYVSFPLSRVLCLLDSFEKVMVGQLMFRCSVQFGQLVDREPIPEAFERVISRRTKQVNRT
jgi:hypothetical protein